MANVTVNRNIFREYDIRGIVERDMPPEVVYLLGRGVGTYQRRRNVKRVALGRDCRLTSDTMAVHFSDGLLASGLDVIWVGVVPTPLLYFACHELDVDGGVMITGSHNPAEYNGFKVLVGTETIHGSQIQEIASIIEAGDFEEGNGVQTHQEVTTKYLAMVKENIRPTKSPVKVLIDAGNGTGGVVAAPLYRSLGHQVSELYCEMDGRFPNHHPDPTIEANLVDAKQAVAKGEVSLVIAFDGDADRIGVVDDKGSIIWGDKLMILLSRQILKEKPGATVIGEVKCSQTLFDDVKAHGGNPIMWKVGHSLIKAKMRETGAMLAGEMSGHIFFKHRYYGYDDAIYTGARLLEILSETGQSVSQLLADVPATVSTPEIRIDCPDEIKFQVVDAAVDYFRKHHEVVDVDGVRVMFRDGAWGLVRASNTQPALVMRFEARDASTLTGVRAVVEDEVNRLMASM